MKILNLYAGIGGNRKLWDQTGEHEITAVEYDPKIAAIYKDFFPNDIVIVADAHQYLLDHYKEFDFIWGSPPCPTHSCLNTLLHAKGMDRFPDMRLYQEVIFLKHFFEGLYCIENVIPYYEPLVTPQIRGRHAFWSNFTIPPQRREPTIGSVCKTKVNNGKSNKGVNHHKLGFDISRYRGIDKMKTLNNCVPPEIGLAILQSALGIITENSVKAGQLF